jgi:hypothetical protein
MSASQNVIIRMPHWRSEKLIIYTEKQNLLGYRLKTVLQTDLSVDLTEKSVVTKDLVRFLKTHEFFETMDQIYRANKFCVSMYTVTLSFFQTSRCYISEVFIMEYIVTISH